MSDNDTKKEFVSRLKKLMGEDSTLRFAKRCGIDEGSMRKYLEGKSLPGLLNAKKIADAEGVSIDWLAGSDNNPNSADLVLIPRLDVSASAGDGALTIAYEDEASDLIAVAATWLGRRGLIARNLRTITARGDSMEPTIRNGDLLLVDHSIDRIVDEGIYVVSFDNLVLVKRLLLGDARGALVLKSDNPSYVPQVRNAGDVRVIGRVCWYGRTI